MYRSVVKMRWCALPLLAVVLAGCGSGGSSSITVGNESDVSSVPTVAGEKPAVSTASTAPAAAAVSAVKTPATGPLSKEPKVSVPKGPAPTKLVSKEIIKGTGAEAKAGETVTVNYVGVLYKTGKVFNASWETKEPFSFPLGKGQVIPGWDQGVPGMKVGGRRELIIPSALAYGTKGSPPKIPANSPLIFIVDLLKA